MGSTVLADRKPFFESFPNLECTRCLLKSSDKIHHGTPERELQIGVHNCLSEELMLKPGGKTVSSSLQFSNQGRVIEEHQTPKAKKCSYFYP